MNIKGILKRRHLFAALACVALSLLILWIFVSYPRRHMPDDLVPVSDGGVKFEAATRPNEYYFAESGGNYYQLFHLINSKEKFLKQEPGPFAQKWVYCITFGAGCYMGNALPVNINAGFADSTEKYVVLIGKYNFAINGTVYSFTESSMYEDFLDVIDFYYKSFTEEYPMYLEKGQELNCNKNSLESSAMFSEADVIAAINCVKKDFPNLMPNGELTDISYDVSQSNSRIQYYDINDRLGADPENIMVLSSDIKQNFGEIDNIEETYTISDFYWILVRDSDSDNWRVVQ